MSTSIYYFSGTGNCFAIARDIAKKNEDCKLVPILSEMQKEQIIVDSDKSVFIFPVYAYDMPKIFAQFFKRAQITSRYIAVVASYASSYGAALLQAQRHLEKKGKTPDLLYDVRCVENYIPMFGVPSETKIKNLVDNQRIQTEKLAEAIKNEEKLSLSQRNAASVVISKLFRLFKGSFTWSYRLSSDCNGCALCSRICPAGAITMKDSKPKFSYSKCEHCQGCMNWCPKKAIVYVNYSPSSRRYTHPDTKPSDLAKH